jgi:hypothetical protein
VARHVWDTKRYADATLDHALRAGWVAIGGGLIEAGAVCRWIGYNVEAIRQRGFRDGYYAEHGGATTPALMFRSASSSGHRYARGRNSGNYLLAGRRMLSQMDPATELAPGVPVGLILDKLTEELG